MFSWFLCLLFGHEWGRAVSVLVDYENEVFIQSCQKCGKSRFVEQEKESWQE